LWSSVLLLWCPRDDTSIVAPQVRQAVANTQLKHGD
jgi:hypothetical protein